MLDRHRRGRLVENWQRRNKQQQRSTAQNVQMKCYQTYRHREQDREGVRVKRIENEIEETGMGAKKGARDRFSTRSY